MDYKSYILFYLVLH